MVKCPELRAVGRTDNEKHTDRNVRATAVTLSATRNWQLSLADVAGDQAASEGDLFCSPDDDAAVSEDGEFKLRVLRMEHEQERISADVPRRSQSR